MRIWAPDVRGPTRRPGTPPARVRLTRPSRIAKRFIIVLLVRPVKSIVVPCYVQVTNRLRAGKSLGETPPSLGAGRSRGGPPPVRIAKAIPHAPARPDARPV